MAMNRQSVAGKPPITLLGTGLASTHGAEVVAFHYVNTTAGVGRVDIYDGIAIPANLRVTLGGAVANGADNFSPVQAMRFNTSVNIVFTTGTGIVTVLMN